jgi:hypothetical protein
MAGQHTEMGEVIVTNDDKYLYVEFVAYEPWVIVETHVAVSDSLDGIPQTKKGNPKIGNFEYSIDSFIDLGDWPCGTDLYIAAHAVVQMLDENGNVIDEQTAWGEGEPFNDKGSWAMYFMHTVQCCPKEMLLPDGYYTAKFYHPGPSSYWKTVLSGIPSGYNVWDGPWLGWCVDQGHYIYNGATLQVRFYTSYDPTMPDYAKDDDWDMVNYVINHKDPAASIQDIQDTIWYFVNGGHWPSDPHAQGMINDALANGEGFYPAPGEWMAIILDPSTLTGGKRSQLTIIEVDP